MDFVSRRWFRPVKLRWATAWLLGETGTPAGMLSVYLSLVVREWLFIVAVPAARA
jgi:hypothetical protein